jgi:hypothetical protein
LLTILQNSEIISAFNSYIFLIFLKKNRYGQITLTISSDEAGVFNIDASFMGIKLPDSMELRLEDLLQDQYNGVQVIMLFDMAKVNLNLLTYLLNKKFYV